MKNTLALAFSLVAISLPLSAASAAETVQIKTGTGATGGPDTWFIDSVNSDSTAMIPETINEAWYAGGAAQGVNGNVDGARWITPSTNGNANQPQGTVTYGTVFKLSDIATVAKFTGNFWSDNRVVSILLNGVQIYANNNGLASQFSGNGTPLNLFGDVKAGDNILEFRVQNDSGDSGNPAGLRVSALATAVPEPGTWMLMMLGLGAVGFSMRRRQKTQVRFQFA